MNKFKKGDRVTRNTGALGSVFKSDEEVFVVSETVGNHHIIITRESDGRYFGIWALGFFSIALPTKPIRPRDINKNGDMSLAQIKAQMDMLREHGLLIED